MRIRDWSSDVCSSDLHRLEICRFAELEAFRLGGLDDGAGQRMLALAFEAGHQPQRVGVAEAGPGYHVDHPRPPFGERADRKSVVKGTSVSVRVDPGGRRVLKQKKK